MKSKGAKLVSSAILGKDYKVISVGGKSYMLKSPTIAQISGVAFYLSDVKDGNTLLEILRTLNDGRKYCCALSYLIKGDESLADELSHGTIDEVIGGIMEGYNMISLENFIMLSTLKKSVTKLIAKPR